MEVWFGWLLWSMLGTSGICRQRGKELCVPPRQVVLGHFTTPLFLSMHLSFLEIVSALSGCLPVLVPSSGVPGPGSGPRVEGAPEHPWCVKPPGQNRRGFPRALALWLGCRSQGYPELLFCVCFLTHFLLLNILICGKMLCCPGAAVSSKQQEQCARKKDLQARFCVPSVCGWSSLWMGDGPQHRAAHSLQPVHIWCGAAPH